MFDCLILGFDMNDTVFVVIDRTPPSVCTLSTFLSVLLKGKKDILTFFKVIDLILCYLVA